MKRYYSVSFKHSDFIYCSNIAHAENAEDVKTHYLKYEWVNIREATAYELEEVRRKGKPIVKIEASQKITR